MKYNLVLYLSRNQDDTQGSGYGVQLPGVLHNHFDCSAWLATKISYIPKSILDIKD